MYDSTYLLALDIMANCPARKITPVSETESAVLTQVASETEMKVMEEIRRTSVGSSYRVGGCPLRQP